MARNGGRRAGRQRDVERQDLCGHPDGLYTPRVGAAKVSKCHVLHFEYVDVFTFLSLFDCNV